MVKVGIDSIAIYTSRYALDLKTLAKARGIDHDKFHVGLGQYMMSVPPPGEDIVTMAANAGKQAIAGMNVNDFELLLFATESSIDQSKAAGIYVHDLLDLPARCRVVELKQACYSATAAMQLALPYLRENPKKKVLLVASDIARYGLHTSGESSQGCGAVAMILSVNPRIIAFEEEYGVMTSNVMDFWRPNYTDEAFVEGKYSSKLYLQMLEKSWEQYTALSQRHFSDHDYFCYHMPVPRLVEKAHQYLAKISGIKKIEETLLQKHIGLSVEYGKNIGNSYSASLYVGLTSLLDLSTEDLARKRIGFYSYGSGCVAEYFSGIIQPGYQSLLKQTLHQRLLQERKTLTYDDYVNYYSFKYPKDGSNLDIPLHHMGTFRLAAIRDHKRIYEKRP